MKHPLLICLCLLFATATPRVAVAAGVSGPGTLDQLLNRVRQGLRVESAENRRREEEFRKRKEDQQRLLQEARDELAAEEARSKGMEREFQENERRLAQLEQTRNERLGSLGEAFGVVRQVAGDTRGHLQDSFVSDQIPGREEFLQKLAQSSSLPPLDALERLWFTLQQEMTESGKVVRFRTTIVTTDGIEVKREVRRVGNFVSVSDGKYLYKPQDTGKLTELPRQPAARYLEHVREFESATGGLHPLGVDPTRGRVLAARVDSPDTRERVEQGGPIGLVIIVLGAVAGLVGLVRLAYIVVVGRKVRAQQRLKDARSDNPLGRVLAVYDEHRTTDVETLELRLDEAILRESARLERYLWSLKIVSVVAPLLGLLGTVTGMIRTFQSIVLFGAGDPKLMAGGISEALVTTMLGLMVAIPLVLLHAIAASGSGRIVDILEEQSAGMVAARAEERDVAV